MEDCYGLMGLKVTWTDLNWVFFFVFFFFLGGGGREGRVKLFHCIARTGVYASNKFSSLLFIFPRYSQWSRRQCGLTSFVNCHL